MSSNGFLADLLTGMSEAIAPLEEMLTSPEDLQGLLLHTGWVLEEGANLTDVDATLRPIYEAIPALTAAAEKIAALPNDADEQTVLATLGEVTVKLAPVIRAISDLVGAAYKDDWPSPLNQAEFWASFAEEVFDLLMVLYVRDHAPVLFGFLRFLGIFTEELQRDPPELRRRPYLKRTIHWDRILTLVTGPKDLFPTVYGWGNAVGSFKHREFLLGTQALIGGFGLLPHQSPMASERADAYFDAASIYRKEVLELRTAIFAAIVPVAQTLEQVQVSLVVLPIPEGDPNGPPDGFALIPVTEIVGAASFDLSPSAKLELSGGLETDPVRLEITPRATKVTTALSAAIEAKGVLSAKPEGGAPWILFGAKDSTRMELASAGAGMTVKGPVEDLEYIIEANLDGLALVIDLGEGDGFLQKLLGGKPQRLDLSAVATWSSKKGFALRGQAELEATLAVHLSIGGVLSIDTIYISIRAGKDEKNRDNARLIVAASGGLAIGPVAATVDRVGLQMTMTPTQAGAAGNLGNLDIDYKFKPPNGLGIVVEAGPVVGGGYVFFDSDKGQYAGVLQLSLSFIQIKAIGILDTKFPTDQPGTPRHYSFLLIITTEFTPIQLGMGFSLNGVGGMAGINRSMAVDVLRAGVKTGALGSILFPVDPVKNARKIVSDLESIFPPAEGRYVFGPMVKIGWAQSLVTGELGLILEIPDPVRLVLIGIITAALPDPDNAIVILRLDILGVISFAEKKLAVDASLYQSSILTFPLIGDAAVRMEWGSTKSFAFAVGGFNPRFQPPPAFPTLRRLTLSIGSGSNPRLTCDSYMALTSNSAQFGAHIELYASYALTLHGYLGFDALFIFSPFSFQTEMHAIVDALAGDEVLSSIHLDLTLSGPTPWDIAGSASLEMLFFSVSVNFHVRFGAEQQVSLPARDTLEPFGQALTNPANWSGDLEDDEDRVISLMKATPGAGHILVHPLGTLAVHQRVAPLGLQITMFGPAQPAGADKFDVLNTTVNRTTTVPNETIPDDFAMAQFVRMSDSEKLTAPSYESKPAGIRMSTNEPKISTSASLAVHYETFIIDDAKRPSREGPIYRLPAFAQAAALRHGAAASFGARSSGLGRFVPPGTTSPIQSADASYVIAKGDDLSVRSDLLTAKGASYASAAAALRAYAKTNPADALTLQIMPTHELPA